MERTMGLPFAGAMSLQDELAARRIGVIDRDVVSATKRAFVEAIRVKGPLGWLARLLSDARLAVSAMMLLSMLAVWRFDADAAMQAFGLFAVVVLIGTVAAWVRLEDYAPIWRIRDAGAHWRRARIRFDTEGRRYLFRGARPFDSEIPCEAERVIEEVSAIPGAKVRVEYCSHDPFIVVTRWSWRGRETAYVFHW